MFKNLFRIGVSIIACFTTPLRGEYKDEIESCVNLYMEEDCRYYIVSETETSLYDDVRAYLVLNIEAVRYNVYIVDHSVFPEGMYITPKYLVDKYVAAPLLLARSIFPSYCLMEFIYGF